MFIIKVLIYGSVVDYSTRRGRREDRTWLSSHNTLLGKWGSYDQLDWQT